MNVKQEIDQRVESLKGDFENLSQDLRKNSRKVWLAGLGAVSLVDEQSRELFGERFGERFEDLVEKGEKRRRRLEGNAREAFEKVGLKVKELGREVEQGTTQRVGRTLERLGVPTSAQIQVLIERVEQLNQKVEKLAGA